MKLEESSFSRNHVCDIITHGSCPSTCNKWGYDRYFLIQWKASVRSSTPLFQKNTIKSNFMISYLGTLLPLQLSSFLEFAYSALSTSLNHWQPTISVFPWWTLGHGRVRVNVMARVRVTMKWRSVVRWKVAHLV